LSDGTEYPNVRIIAINTQSCYNWNFYLWSTRDDPGHELDWLENLLSQMEKDGEIGIITGHVPVGEQCLFEWSIRFKALTERYQHILRFSIFGHVHNEYHGVYRSSSTPNPIGVNYWAGSVTTFGSNNPSFRVFEIDAETMLPVKIHTFVFDISEANPAWKHDHEMTELYGMKDLSPSSFDELSNRFKNDEALSATILTVRTQGA